MRRSEHLSAPSQPITLERKAYLTPDPYSGTKLATRSFAPSVSIDQSQARRVELLALSRWFLIPRLSLSVVGDVTAEAQDSLAAP